MTNEEIIKWLMNLKNDIGEMQYQQLWHYAEALDIAIETLEQCEMAYEHGWTDAESNYREMLERQRGEWVLDDDQVYECKDCGYVPSFDGYTYFNYCPNCGADMHRRKE